MGNAHRAGLGLVDAGWTGVVTTTRGAVVATVTPVGRMSAIEVWLRVQVESTRVHGGDWSVYVDGSERLVIGTSLASFDLAATLVTQTRLALTAGPYTGLPGYTGAAAHFGAVYPTRGIDFQGGRPAVDRGRPSGTGALGLPGAPGSSSGTVRCWGTLTELIGLEGTLTAAEAYDAWVDGRGVARFWLGDVSRSRWTRDHRQAFLELNVREVTS